VIGSLADLLVCIPAAIQPRQPYLIRARPSASQNP
jgi:hypothetical protein